MLRRQLTRKQLLPFSGAAGAMPGGDGSLRGCTLLAPGDRPTRSHRAADEPALRQAVAQEPENDGNDAEAICKAAGRCGSCQSRAGLSRTSKHSIVFVSSN